jgi:hypothetical protein
MQARHKVGFENIGLTLILESFVTQPAVCLGNLGSSKEKTMKPISRLAALLSALFNRRNNAVAARQLLERAASSKGLSQGDVAQLRANALAVLRVVR